MSANAPRTCLLDADSLGPDLDFSRLLEATGPCDRYGNTSLIAIPERLAGVEVAVTNKVPLDAAAFDAADRLRLVCIAATGTNNVDLDAARAHGVTVCNATGYGTPAVVQHTFALLLALATRLEHYHAAARDGRWARHEHFCLLDQPIVELQGLHLGIVGLGELGRGVARLAEAFGMEVMVAARPGEPVPEDRVSLDTLIEHADVISLHCPLTPSTRGLIGKTELDRMKDSAFLLNTARGGIVDEEALAEALRRGSIAGAGVDVLSEEPPRSGNPLLAPDIPNLIVTPHSAWGTRAARQRLIDHVAENIVAWRAGRPRNMVAGDSS